MRRIKTGKKEFEGLKSESLILINKCRFNSAKLFLKTNFNSRLKNVLEYPPISLRVYVSIRLYAFV